MENHAHSFNFLSLRAGVNMRIQTCPFNKVGMPLWCSVLIEQKLCDVTFRVSNH
jgi:hypothetical protein